MRQRYETEGDRQAEEVALRAYLAGTENASYRKLGPSYPADFAVVGPTKQITAFVEVKCRSCLSTTYPTLQISLKKLADLAGLYQTSGIPAVLLVAYQDKILCSDVSRATYSPADVTLGGREDREDPADIEPMLNLSISRMRLVHQKKDFII